MKRTKADDLWLEFVDSGVMLCGLCGNTGLLSVAAWSAAGVGATTRGPCICPNGRAIKKQREISAKYAKIKLKEETP